MTNSYSLLQRTRTLWAVMFCWLSAHTIFAQVATNYIFSQASGTYTPITGGTVLGNTSTDDQRFVDPSVPLGGTTTTGPGLPIGFDFVYNGNTYDRFGINANGWIAFGSSSLTPAVNLNSSSSYTPLSASSTATPTHLRNRVAALGRDLQAQTGAELRYETIGTAPNRILVVQWTGYRKYLATGDNFNFQIRLEETTNRVVIVYGSFTSNTTSTTVQVGLGGIIETDFNNRTSTTDWSTTTAGAANNATITLSNTVVPALGLTYIWSPPTPCSGTPPVLTATATPSSGCVGSSVTLSVPPVFASGITYQWQADTGSGFSNILGATSATSTTSLPAAASVTYRCVVTCTNSGISTNSTTATVSVTGVPTYATLPYSQNFEGTWQTSACVTSPIAEDRPDSSWVNTPASGNQSWRRDDRGPNATISGWTFTSSGLYSPTGALSTSRSARFHTYGALNGTFGTLDLYIDLSSSPLNKVLSFYYINTSGTDNLVVQISTDGGVSFAPLTTSPANPLVVQTQWTLVTATITSSSPTTVIRFRATSDYGFTDIGIDEVNVIIPPDIEVRGIDNSVIANGSVVTSLVNGTNYGTISVASTPFLDRTFTIANPGTQPLTISSVTSSNPNFIIQASPASPVAGGGTTTFTVRFQPTTFGNFNSTISIANNVPTKNPYTFRVEGIATAPTIAVSGLGNNIPNNKTLTMTTDGTFLGVATSASPTLSSTFTITNNGNENLTINSIGFPSGSSFSASGVPSSVAANGGTADFNVIFNSSGGGKIDTVIIRSNAANAPEFRYLVSAGGIVSALDNNLSEGDLLITPNPSKGKFNIYIGGTKYTSVKAVVYDVTGRVIKTAEVPQFSGNMDIDLSEVQGGTYILMLETGGEKIARKLVKQ